MPEILSILFPSINLNPVVPSRCPHPHLSMLLEDKTSKMLISSLIKDQSNNTTQDKTKISEKFTHTYRDILADNGNNNKDKLRVIDIYP